MSSRARAFRYMVLFVITVIGVMGMLTLLPHDKAFRYARLTDDFSKAGWIYNRTHIDPRPVDVVFLGTSHTMAAVDERAVAQVSTKTDAPTIVNYALPQHGRNLHYVLAKALFEEKKPRLLVLEIRETESRFGHPLFQMLADPEDVLWPVMVVNRFSVSDLASLPLRQASLFLETQVHDGVLDPNHGPVGGDVYVQGRHSGTMQTSALQEASEQYIANKQWNVLGKSLDWLEYRFPRQYLERIVAMAKENGTELAFLYLPFFGADPAHRDESKYLEWGDVWYPPRSILEDSRNWVDVTHLNERGSTQLTSWLQEKIAKYPIN